MSELDPTVPKSDTKVAFVEASMGEHNPAVAYVETRPQYSDLAGLDEPVRRLKDVATIISNFDLACERDVRRPTGILLHGPAGVGKTALVGAFSRDVKAELINVDVSQVLGTHVGESNTKLKKLFTDVKSIVHRNVLFFDEIDGLFSTNAGGNSGVNTSLVAEMKSILSGLRETHPNTIVMGCTNELDGYDSALLRPGRFDVIIPVSLPNAADRVDIFNSYVTRRADLYTIGEADSKVHDSKWVNLTALAAETEGMTGADIESILHTARASRLVAYIERKEKVSRVTQADILRAITLHRHSRSIAS